MGKEKSGLQTQGGSSPQDTLGLHQHQGGRVPHQSWTSEKEGITSSRFHKTQVQRQQARSTTWQPAMEDQTALGFRRSAISERKC